MTDKTDSTDRIVALIERLVVAGVTPDKAAEEAFRWDARKSRAESRSKNKETRIKSDPAVGFFLARKTWLKPAAFDDVAESMRMFKFSRATAYRKLSEAGAIGGDTPAAQNA
jgi:hypothetical protein